MAGLLSDVLPFIYSQSDRLKRRVGGLLSDPLGTMEQTAGGLLDSNREQQGLLEKAFADKGRPFKVTDDAAMQQAAMNMLQGPLGFAPAGITAWHGSPHIFDKFDSSKIGTGEGAQAYGHGLYLAENPEVSKTYMRTQIGNASELEQMALRAGVSKDAANTIAGWYHQTKDAKGLDKFLELMREPAPSPYIQKFRDSVVKEEPALRKAWQSFTDPGSLYKVDLPDSAVAKMLDWDKPLSEQAPEVQKAIEAAGLRFPPNASGKQVHDAFAARAISALDPSMRGALGANQVAASQTMRQAGIPGIRYLDGGSRGAGQGSSNYVIFPQEEGLLTILERNGVPLR